MADYDLAIIGGGLNGVSIARELTGAEVRYLMTQEWARFPDDVLWRRSKLGLTMPAQDREALTWRRNDWTLKFIRCALR
jgi:glycerol-3-phosphate dehydrogenase